MNTLNSLFTSNFMPHGHCYFWRPDILWTHVISDAAIATAYFCIPAILLYFLFKKKLTNIPFWWVIVLFAGFIYLCGITHIVGIITVWTPIYVIEGWFKAATAIISVITASSLIFLIPKALTLKSPAELERVNAALNKEILERDRVQRELHTTVTKLRASNQELEDITSITAHDLQAPLRRMITFADALEEKLRDKNILDEDLNTLLQNIDKNGKRMRGHINDVLNFSTVHAGLPDSQEVDPNETLNEIITDLQISSDVDLQVAKLPTVNTSPKLLYHVLHNLLENAIKYRSTERPLEILIDAEKTKNDQGHSCWKFSVSDNGIGIDIKQAEKVFKLFGRLHDEKQYAGSGMGLATVRKMLVSHGGNIWLEQTESKGACFCFTLPA